MSSLDLEETSNWSPTEVAWAWLQAVGWDYTGSPSLTFLRSLAVLSRHLENSGRAHPQEHILSLCSVTAVTWLSSNSRGRKFQSNDYEARVWMFNTTTWEWRIQIITSDYYIFYSGVIFFFFNFGGWSILFWSSFCNMSLFREDILHSFIDNWYFKAR